MTRPAATPDDLDWLLTVLRDSLPVTLGPKPTREQRARLSRCEDFIVTALDVREAQRTRSGTAHHRQLMEAYYTARDAWQAAEEAFSAGYPAEKREYADLHPRPTLKEFMRAHARRHRDADQTMVCPECGATITPIPAEEAAAA